MRIRYPYFLLAFLALFLIVGPTNAQAQASPRPSLQNLQLQLDDLRNKMCIHSDVTEEVRPLFCSPRCSVFSELLEALQPNCGTFDGLQVCGSGQILSCDNNAGVATVVVESVGGDDCISASLGSCSGNPLNQCPGGGSCDALTFTCRTIQCNSTTLPNQSTLVLQGLQPMDDPGVVQRSFGGFLCSVIDYPLFYGTGGAYWATQMDDAATPPRARDLCLPLQLNANDALECLSQIETALGQSCTS